MKSYVNVFGTFIEEQWIIDTNLIEVWLLPCKHGVLKELELLVPFKHFNESLKYFHSHLAY